MDSSVSSSGRAGSGYYPFAIKSPCDCGYSVVLNSMSHSSNLSNLGESTGMPESVASGFAGKLSAGI